MSVPRCFPSRQLRPGSPAAPGAFRLGLLPSGPDPVHGAPPRRTQPSTPRARCFPNGRHPQAGSSAPRIEGFGCRTPLASRLARSREMVPEEAGCFLPQEGAARRWGRWPRRSRGRRGFVLFPPLASGASVGGGGRGGAEDGGGSFCFLPSRAERVLGEVAEAEPRTEGVVPTNRARSPPSYPSSFAAAVPLPQRSTLGRPTKTGPTKGGAPSETGLAEGEGFEPSRAW